MITFRGEIFAFTRLIFLREPLWPVFTTQYYGLNSYFPRTQYPWLRTLRALPCTVDKSHPCHFNISYTKWQIQLRTRSMVNCKLFTRVIIEHILVPNIHRVSRVVIVTEKTIIFYTPSKSYSSKKKTKQKLRRSTRNRCDLFLQ